MSTPLDHFIEAFKDQDHYPDCLCMCGPGAHCDCTFEKDVAEILTGQGTLETELAAAMEREKGLREALEELQAIIDNSVPEEWPSSDAAAICVKQALALCTEGKTNTPAAYP